MIIREFTKESEDIKEGKRVSSAAFVWPINWDEEIKLDTDLIIGAFCEDNQTAMAEIECFDYENFYGNGTLKCLGVGGVATKPEYRNQGAVRALFSRAFDMAPEKNWAISILYPFSTVYYRKFGYEPVAKYMDLTVPFSDLQHVTRNCDVQLYQGENMQELVDLYNCIAAKTNLMFKRKDNVYFSVQPYEKCEYTYVWKDSTGTACAYVSFTLHRPTAIVHVKELLFEDKAALLGIIGFLRNFEGNFTKIHFQKLPINTPVCELIHEKNHMEAKIHNGGAARILNVETVLNTNAYPKQYGHFSFLSTDALPWNSGIFDVEYENGRPSVTRRTAGDYDAALDPLAQVRLLLAHEGLDYKAMDYLNGIEIKHENEDLLRAFPRLDTLFYDGF